MRRLLPAAFLALGLHALLFSLDLGRALERRSPPSAPEWITLTLAREENRVPVVNEHKPEPTVTRDEPPPPPPIRKKKISKAESSRKPERKTQLSEREDRAASFAEPPPQPKLPAEVAAIPRNQVSPEQSDVSSPGTNLRASIPVRETPPVYRTNPPPQYPALARRRGYEGTVLVEALVSRDGSVRDLRLTRSSGYSVLDRAAMASVKEWFFEPATINEEKVEMWVKVPVRFRLD